MTCDPICRQQDLDVSKGKRCLIFFFSFLLFPPECPAVCTWVCLEGRESVPLAPSLSLARAAWSPTRFARESRAKRKRKKKQSESRIDSPTLTFSVDRDDFFLVSLSLFLLWTLPPPGRAFVSPREWGRPRGSWQPSLPPGQLHGQQR